MGARCTFYDTGSGDGPTGLAVFWQHGTPSIVAGQALATDQGGIVDDDLAYVTPGAVTPGG